jgi:hypothetical protein
MLKRLKLHRFAYLLVAAIYALWIALVLSSRDLGTDFYPLYFAARRIMEGLSPYGPQATAELARLWHAPFASAGIAYPLPFLLLVVPLGLLPFAIAAGLWILAGAAGIAASLRLAGNWRLLILLPLLFLPVYRGVVLGQATLVWFGLAVLLVLGIQYRWGWAVGIAAALLILKPQNGLLFALAGLVWAIRADRRALIWFVGVESLLLIGTFLVDPGWPAAWLAQVQSYNAIVHPPSLLLWGLVLVLVAWRQPWWSIVAACQVVFFPLSDLYSALPLLLCWVAIGGPLALFGAGVSWIWSLAGLPNSVSVLWGLVICPLMLAIAWRSWGEPYFSRQSAVGSRQVP